MLRPAILFFAQFAAFSSPGRFASVFLASFGLSESQVGLVLVAPTVLSICLVLFGGSIVDRLRDGKRRGIVLLNVVSCLFFQCLGLPIIRHAAESRAVLTLAIVLFVGYSIARGSINPVLTAYTLDYLERKSDDVNDLYTTDVTMQSESHVEDATARKRMFGRERLWGAVSWGLVSVVHGFFVDMFGFQVTFVFNALTTVAVVALLTDSWLPSWLRVGGPRPAEDALEHREPSQVTALSPMDTEPEPEGVTSVRTFVVSLACDVRVVALLVTAACVSVGTALVENLIFLFFTKDLKASNLLCGLSIIVTVAFEIPLFYISDKLINIYGTGKMLLFGILCYVVRVVIYTVLDPEHAWLILLVEPLHGVTYSMVTTATVLEMSAHSPPELETMGQSILAASRMLGTVVGTLGGSIAMERIGSIITYRAAAALVSIAGLMYYSVHRALPVEGTKSNA